jgi:hypothetical protein
MKLYVVTYFGLSANGYELFCKERVFSDKDKALACLQTYTNEFRETLSQYLYPERVRLYTRLKVSEEKDGEFKYICSKVYSYSEGLNPNSDEDRDKRCEKINTCPEFFKTI